MNIDWNNALTKEGQLSFKTIVIELLIGAGTGTKQWIVLVEGRFASGLLGGISAAEV